MGWKAIKQHFRIGHLVHVEKGMVCIGSPYISTIISIGPEGVPAQSQIGLYGNSELRRYWDEIEAAGPDAVRELIEQDDEFEKSLPVFAWDHESGSVVERKCEGYGWPNVTHCGVLMYENDHFADRADAVAYGLDNARSWVSYGKRELGEAEARVVKLRSELERREEDLAALLADPDAPEKEAAKS
ncbi:MAG: hypothetical protein ACPGVY_17580 [Mycobacterium sp.]